MTNAVYLASLVNSTGYNVTLSGGVVGAGTGVAFPATQSASSDANTLDDYEEGTWTPIFSASGYTFTYGSQNGYYTKIGSVVIFKLYMAVSVASGSGSSQGSISGLPYTSSNISANYGGISVNPDTGSAYLTTGGYTMTARTSPNSNSFPFYIGNGGNSLKGNITWSGMSAGTEFEISGHYFTT
jgi:hypothetical protein